MGSGPPEGFAWLSRRGEVIGCDVDPLFTRGADPSRFVRARAEALPFAAGSFDAVCAFDVLEHLDDDAGALREMARVAAPGGALVITVPAMPSLWGPHDVVNRHRRRYTRRSLRDAFARAGLPGARIHYFNTLLFPPIAAVRWSGRLLGRREAGSDFERAPVRGPVLERILGFERHLVGRVPFPFGVSLVAWLRR